MIKTCCLFFFLCFSFSCFAQKNDAYSGFVLTKIDSNDTGPDTTLQLYCRNNTGDRLSVYTVRDGSVSEATAYYFTATNQGLYFYSKSLLAGRPGKDSLRVTFQDKTYAVLINGSDRFILFPDYYTRFKQQVKVKGSVITFLTLLSDAIGDYPVADVLPLFIYTPKFDPQIRQARIVTQRSQADMKDIWTCKYFYNKYNRLDSVNAGSAEEVRFSKKVHFNPDKTFTISTYLNIEDRQVTSRIMSYGNKDGSPVKWEESYEEMGKNRETMIAVTLTRHELGMLQKIDLSPAEVLKLLKPIKTHDYTKKHID